MLSESTPHSKSCHFSMGVLEHGSPGKTLPLLTWAVITDRRPTHHGRKGALKALPAPKDLYTFNSCCARVFLQWCSHLQVVHGSGSNPHYILCRIELHLRTVSLPLSSMPYMGCVDICSHLRKSSHHKLDLTEASYIQKEFFALSELMETLFPQKWMIYTLKSYQILAPTGKNVTEQLLHKSHWVREKDGEVKMWSHEYPWQEELIGKDDDNIQGCWVLLKITCKKN